MGILSEDMLINPGIQIVNILKEKENLSYFLSIEIVSMNAKENNMSSWEIALIHLHLVMVIFVYLINQMLIVIPILILAIVIPLVI